MASPDTIILLIVSTDYCSLQDVMLHLGLYDRINDYDDDNDDMLNNTKIAFLILRTKIIHNTNRTYRLRQ